MQQVTFITGNPKKAEYLEKHLGFSVAHLKLDLDEIQSLDLRQIVEHKVKKENSRVKLQKNQKVTMVSAGTRYSFLTGIQ